MIETDRDVARNSLGTILGPEKDACAIALVYGVATGFLMLAVPICVQMLIDVVASSGARNNILTLSISLMGGLLICMILGGAQASAMERFKRRVFVRLTRDMTNRLAGTGETSEVHRFFEIVQLQSLVPNLVTQGALVALQSIIGLTLISFYHPVFAVFSLLYAGLVFLIWRMLHTRSLSSERGVSDAKYAAAYALKACAESKRPKAEAMVVAEEMSARYLLARNRHFRFALGQQLSFAALYAVASAALLGIGGYLVIAGQLTLGQLVAAELVASGIFYGMSRFASHLGAYYETRVSTEKLDRLLPRRSEKVNQEAPPHLHPKVARGLRMPYWTRKTAWMLLLALPFISAGLLFVPWVQTAQGEGKVTSLRAEDRAQTINAPLDGRIKLWYVHDGSAVKAGDPLVEIVDNDPLLIERLEKQRTLLIGKLKASRAANITARQQVDRQLGLLAKGFATRQTVEAAQIRARELETDEASAATELNSAEIQLSRQAVQVVRAPRDGTIVHIMSGDDATFVKNSDVLANFLPADTVPAVEMLVSGMDAPLVSPGRPVRLQFEGWPVVQFSGWPSVAVGTFDGTVASIDPIATTGGEFRVLVTADSQIRKWPDQRYLRFGTKAKGWVLLDSVPLGYEFWRRLNKFPPRPPAG